MVTNLPILSQSPEMYGRVNESVLKLDDGPCFEDANLTYLSNKCVIAKSLDVCMDFTRPDGQRTRPLVAGNKRLYVDEHYISVWSPILRSWCIECPQRELVLPNVSYDHLLELIECIHPTYKDVDEKNYQIILPLAFDYQMDGLLHRCECYLESTRMGYLEKLWLADRYKLNRLLVLCLRELRPSSKLDISGPRYYGLSDRVKVLLLERIHGSMAPEEIPESPIDAEQFHRSNDIQFGTIRAKTGRLYHINPYYMAAWSNVVHERLTSTNTNEFYSGCTHEELKAFLMAVHPPQMRLTGMSTGFDGSLQTGICRSNEKMCPFCPGTPNPIDHLRSTLSSRHVFFARIT